MALVNLGALGDGNAAGPAPWAGWLSPEEQTYLGRFRLAKRRTEWIGGRIAAKVCLVHGRPDTAPERITILPDDHGRPLVPATPASLPRFLSISHSHGLAVALAARVPCGIDLQLVTPGIVKLRERITPTPELDRVATRVAATDQELLTLIWSVKEAVKKQWLADRPGLLEATTITDVRPGTGHWLLTCRVSGRNQEVRARCMEGYVLAWSLAEGEDHA